MAAEGCTPHARLRDMTEQSADAGGMSSERESCRYSDELITLDELAAEEDSYDSADEQLTLDELCFGAERHASELASVATVPLPATTLATTPATTPG